MHLQHSPKIAIVALFQIHPHHLLRGGSKVIAHCGVSPEEAIERGCLWDIMSYGCGTSTQPLSLEEIPFAPSVYAAQGYRLMYCTYLLKMVHVAALHNAPVSNEAVNLGHTDHCSRIFGKTDLAPQDAITTGVGLLYVQCVTLT